MVAFIFTVFSLCLSISEAFDCRIDNVIDSITVDLYGKGSFKSVQSAIDWIPPDNNEWRHILISPGNFREKVTIPTNKPCIVLEGAGIKLTSIQWGDHKDTAESATFTSSPDNIVVKGITFINDYNIPLGGVLKAKKKVMPALAAKIYGDKSAFYNCGFIGLQDTLWDVEGRHYFKDCYIEGAIDFIFGRGQSIYETCQISLNVGNYAPEYPWGYITAQARNSSDDPSAFVFKSCVFKGTGKTYLGRAYGPYSSVIIHNSVLSVSVTPDGWDAWNYVKHEENLMYSESNCMGPGADTSKRVPWMKILSAAQLNHYLDISYIDKEGWIAKQP
ncbi:hypothetical protein PTKIN_Ptkin12aG0146700 [Pterospermum kingtungense]